MEGGVRRLEWEAMRDWLVFLILTGLRRNEAANLKWETVDLRARMFTIPLTKNREPHTLPTSDYLQEMLKRRHEAGGRSDYVFPGEKAGIAEPKKPIAAVVAASGREVLGTHVTAHIRDHRRESGYPVSRA